MKKIAITAVQNGFILEAAVNEQVAVFCYNNIEETLAAARSVFLAVSRPTAVPPPEIEAVFPSKAE